MLDSTDPVLVTALGAFAFLVLAAIGWIVFADTLRARLGLTDNNPFADLRAALTGADGVALVVPSNPGIDAVASGVGLAAACREWGVTPTLVAADEVSSDDTRAFCNLFDVEVDTIDDGVVDEDVAVAVGGGGPVPTLGPTPVVGVVRHRPLTDENRVVVGGTDGATATTVTRLLDWGDVTPDQRTATVLLYGIHAGTSEFRRTRGESDHAAAGRLHRYADRGRLDALRTPGLSDETFDVVGSAIRNRERNATFAVSNVGTVPTVGALEEGADTLLRLDGVTTAAAFGLHDDTVLTSCRAEDVRTNAFDVLSAAFDENAVAGDADAAVARVPLGLFGGVSDECRDTLDELVDRSARRVLRDAFEEG